MPLALCSLVPPFKTLPDTGDNQTEKSRVESILVDRNFQKILCLAMQMEKTFLPCSWMRRGDCGPSCTCDCFVRGVT